MQHRAIVVAPSESGERTAALVAVDDRAPQPGDARIIADWSSINYKDALAVTGAPGVLRRVPLVPGIDVVGRIEQVGDPADEAAWPAGTRLVVTGAGLGETRDGGFAERAIVPLSAAFALPASVSDRDAAAIGTAGFTAALAVLELERAPLPPGPVLVTGAGGGVGGFAIALLAARGHEVVATSGRAGELGDHLRALGAASVIDRLPTAPGRPLQQATWAGVIDSVGGGVLVNAIAATQPLGRVAACGLAGSADLPGSVLPFILRGVTLAGINSVQVASDRRAAAWRLLEQLPAGIINRMVSREVPLDAVADAAPEVLAGHVRGRIIVQIT